MVRGSLLLFPLLAFGAGCGIKGPPLPPLPERARPEASDGGAQAGRLRYRGAGVLLRLEKARLRWERIAGAATGRLAVESHALHGGGESARCGHRRIVALVSPGARVELWVDRPRGRTRFRLLDERGREVGPAAELPGLSPPFAPRR